MRTLLATVATLALAAAPAFAQTTGTNTTSRAPGSGSTTAGTRIVPGAPGTAQPATPPVATPTTDALPGDPAEGDAVDGDFLDDGVDGAGTVPDTTLGTPGSTLGAPDSADDATGVEGGAASAGAIDPPAGTTTPGGR